MVSTIEHRIPQDPFERNKKAILEAAQRNGEIWLKVLYLQPCQSQITIEVFAREHQRSKSGIHL